MTQVDTISAPAAGTRAQSITVRPSLTFTSRAEEAINFYVSLVPNSRVTSMMTRPAGGPLPEGSVLHAAFELDGQRYTAMDGGPTFQFSEAFSLVLTCETQAELDEMWARLSEGGEEGRCGWLKDRFGVSWQVVPEALGEMMGDLASGNPGKLMEALMKMSKLDIATLRQAYTGATRSVASPTRGARRSVSIERVFNAPIEEVWELWTTRDGIESWWGPEGFEVKVRRLDVRPGGDLDYAMMATAPDQVDFLKKAGMKVSNEHRLSFTEVVPMERLAFSHVVDFIPSVEPYEAATTIDFVPTPQGVRLVLTLESMHDEHWTTMAVKGWESELGKLEKVLER